MTALFRDLRFYGYFTVILLSAGVLAISAYFASIFLPNLHHDFSIYSLVPPSWTIFILVLLLISSNPRLDAIMLFITDILWLTLASWSTDVIGNTQCDALGSSRTNTKHGTISARSYCDLSKVLQAISWAIFCLVTLYFIFILILASRAMAMGRQDIWRDDIREMPWFMQAPGYPGSGYTYSSQYGSRAYPTTDPYNQYPTTVYPGGVVQQQHGQRIVVQPGRGGMPTTVSQTPI